MIALWPTTDFGDGFGVARPLWLRLFGANGPTSFSELLDAARNIPLGQGLDDGRVTARLFELAGLTPLSHNRPAAGTDGAAADRLLGAADQPRATLSAEGGPLPAANPDDARNFILDAGAQQAASSVIQRANLELVIPIGTDPQMLSALERDQDLMPSGSWAKIFTRHDFAAIAAAGEGKGPLFDTLSLAGDFSAGFTLSDSGAPLGRVNLAASHNYVLISDDDFVHAGATIVVDGSKVGAGNYVMFDGSAETDGNFAFYGSAGNDIVFGGAGNDWLNGLGGADVLTGGAGADTFVYSKASESTGANYDVLADFDPLADRIALPVKVTGFDAALTAGTLSENSFTHDLASALGGLGANHAALYRPDSGDLAGTVFLVVDGNGVAGYQEGEDYVFALPSTTLASLAGHTDFLI